MYFFVDVDYGIKPMPLIRVGCKLPSFIEPCPFYTYELARILNEIDAKLGDANYFPSEFH